MSPRLSLACQWRHMRQTYMGRPPIENPSAKTLARREQRKRKQRRMAVLDDSGDVTPEQWGRVEAIIARAPEKTPSRLVPVTVYVPPQDVKAALLFAARMRKAARIPESEVPE